MASTYRAFLEKIGGVSSSQYKGNVGEIFWNPTSGDLRLSDSVTSGGIPLTASSNGVQSRSTTATVTATNVPATEIQNIEIVGHKGYVLFSITANKACRVRIYKDNASRTADADRLEGVSPSANSGVIAEAVFTGSQTIKYSPGLFGYNDDDPISTNIPVAVTNKTSGTTDIDIQVNILQTEQQ